MKQVRHIAIITGSRADFGLLESTIRAVIEHPQLQLSLIAAGSHLIGNRKTLEDVQQHYDIAATVPMQTETTTSRGADAAALGRGVRGCAAEFERLQPDVVLVLGDRIEAFAAASAASVAGIRVAHIHGGDRAEGIADEAMRHAITKLAHLHLAATATSAERIRKLGEPQSRIFTVGSPAIDGLNDIPPLDDAAYTQFSSPQILVLMHPIGRSIDEERAEMKLVLNAAMDAGPCVALMPNHDPGREGIVTAIHDSGCPRIDHLPRRQFIGLLKRVQVIVGNSSAGLIECAALGVPAINIGSRQQGRERPGHVIDIPDPAAVDLTAAIIAATPPPSQVDDHPYGDGRAGAQIADILATFDPHECPITKHNTY